MRIISINSHYQDGLGYQDYFLGKEWNQAGHEVHFISSDWHFNFPDYNNTVKHIIGERHVGNGIFENDYGVPIHRLKSFRIGSWLWLIGFKNKINSLKPDVIIMHGVFNFQSIRLSYLAHKFHCPIIFDDHTTINVVRQGAGAHVIFWVFRFFFARRIYRCAKKIVGISHSCLTVLKAKFGLSGSKLELIPLGTDTNIFHLDTKKRLNFRKTLNLGSDSEVVIGYTGKIYYKKKVHLILEALKDENVRNGKIILLLLVGNISNDYLDTIKADMKNSQFKVIHMDSVNQESLSAIYNGIDIAIWPAHTTTSTLDAAACGCPIICSEYMVERYENNNGIGIEDGNLESVKNALRVLINNVDLRKTMGLNGIDLIMSKYNWNSISKEFLK